MNKFIEGGISALHFLSFSPLLISAKEVSVMCPCPPAQMSKRCVRSYWWRVKTQVSCGPKGRGSNDSVTTCDLLL